MGSRWDPSLIKLSVVFVCDCQGVSWWGGSCDRLRAPTALSRSSDTGGRHPDAAWQGLESASAGGSTRDTGDQTRDGRGAPERAQVGRSQSEQAGGGRKKLRGTRDREARERAGLEGAKRRAGKPQRRGAMAQSAYVLAFGEVRRSVDSCMYPSATRASWALHAGAEQQQREMLHLAASQTPPPRPSPNSPPAPAPAPTTATATASAPARPPPHASRPARPRRPRQRPPPPRMSPAEQQQQPVCRLRSCILPACAPSAKHPKHRDCRSCRSCPGRREQWFASLVAVASAICQLQTTSAVRPQRSICPRPSLPKAAALSKPSPDG